MRSACAGLFFFMNPTSKLTLKIEKAERHQDIRRSIYELQPAADELVTLIVPELPQAPHCDSTRGQRPTEVKAMNGIVGKDLVPILPVKIRNKNSEWQEISLLLDTGFDEEIALDAALLDSYNLATQPDHQALTPDEVLNNCDNCGPRAPYTGKVEWQGYPRPVGIRLVAEHPLNGMLGTELLKYHLLTVDAVVGGAVSAERGPPPSYKGRRWWKPNSQERQKAFTHDLHEFLYKEFPKLSGSYLPWTKLQVQDS